MQICQAGVETEPCLSRRTAQSEKMFAVVSRELQASVAAAELDMKVAEAGSEAVAEAIAEAAAAAAAVGTEVVPVEDSEADIPQTAAAAVELGGHSAVLDLDIQCIAVAAARRQSQSVGPRMVEAAVAAHLHSYY